MGLDSPQTTGHLSGDLREIDLLIDSAGHCKVETTDSSACFVRVWISKQLSNVLHIDIRLFYISGWIFALYSSRAISGHVTSHDRRKSASLMRCNFCICSCWVFWTIGNTI